MRLKELRKANKYKQIEIAELLSCSQGVYSRYENEEREPPFDIMKKLAEIYGVTIDYLMGEAPPQNIPDPPPIKEMTPAEMRAEGLKLVKSLSAKGYEEALQYMKFLKEQENK